MEFKVLNGKSPSGSFSQRKKKRNNVKTSLSPLPPSPNFHPLFLVDMIFHQPPSSCHMLLSFCQPPSPPLPGWHYMRTTSKADLKKKVIFFWLKKFKFSRWLNMKSILHQCVIINVSIYWCLTIMFRNVWIIIYFPLFEHKVQLLIIKVLSFFFYCVHYASSSSVHKGTFEDQVKSIIILPTCGHQSKD